MILVHLKVHAGRGGALSQTRSGRGEGDDDYDDDPNNQLWGFVGDDVQGDVDVYFGYVFAIPLGSAVWLPLNDRRRPSAAPVRMSSQFLAMKHFDFRIIFLQHSPADRCGKVIFRRPGPHFGLLDFDPDSFESESHLPPAFS